MWNKRMIQTWIKIKMKGLSSKKGNFSIHQNIMFFQIIKNRGSRSILPATLVQHFSMFTWWWKLGNSLNFNSPISWHLWWELCMLLKILCYLESQYFWSNKGTWLCFSYWKGFGSTSWEFTDKLNTHIYNKQYAVVSLRKMSIEEQDMVWKIFE